MSVGVDFDFPRWLAVRRGAMEQQAREGAAYAFGGERAFRRTLSLARPVTIALEATTRLWRDSARTELLAGAAKPTDDRYAKVLGRVHDCAKTAGANLRVRVPVIFGMPTTDARVLGIKVLGTDDAPHLVVDLALAGQLSDKELTAALGHELGHIQNFHIFYSTALHFLTHSAVFFVRWIIQPAILALQAWGRRAEITCDRAALLACRDVDATLTTIVKLALGVETDVAQYLSAPPEAAAKGVGKYGELFRSHPNVGKRIAALRLFADSALYASLTGQDPTGKISMPDVDKQVGEMISVF
jgi:Zn-dependent protease with chaperone function